jgi:peroxisomal 2,4-dienoyl-CoA reductase
MPSVFREDIFRDRVALVTGGGSGICQGITEALLRHGCQAAIMSRKAERLETAAEHLRKATGQDCLAVAADVRDPPAVEAAVERTLERFGRLDFVVNGAARLITGAILVVDGGAWMTTAGLRLS